MRKCALVVLGLLLSLPAWAAESLEPLLNKVSLQLHAEQWVTTKTALVTIVINAAVSGQGVEKIQNEVMQKLGQFSSKGEWHIISFDRQLDKSGLETLQISAQARLEQGELANLRDKAKSISTPGEMFTIDSVQFTPSEDEIKQANIALRANIYQQVKAEMDGINKMYPGQMYYVHQIDFNSVSPIAPMPENTMYMAKAATVQTHRVGNPLSVGNKQELFASVVLAALPDQLVQKITH